MPQNLYDLTNLGILANLQYLEVDGQAQINQDIFILGQTITEQEIFANGDIAQQNPNALVIFEGQVEHYNYVYFDSQTSVEPNGVFICSGNAQFENSVTFTGNGTPLIGFDNNTNVLFDSYFVEFQTPLSNIFIYGGSNGQVLTTDGLGNLYWSAGGGGGGNASFIANGTSNVSIPSANGNVLISAAGNANVVIITGSEFRVNNKTANLGNVGNVRIGGGSNGDYLKTYGNGSVYYQTLTYEGIGYAVCNPGGNAVTLPVYANSTSTRNIPLKYIGNTVADLWPYGNGSAVANASPGYAANSTAAFTPANAAILNIPTTTTSYDNFYKIIDSNTGSASWGSGTTYIEATFHFDCYANAANAKIQLIPFIHGTGSGDNNLQTQNQMIYEIPVFPEQTAIDITFYLGLGNTVDKLGMYVRNITASTEVTVTNGSLDIRQVE